MRFHFLFYVSMRKSQFYSCEHHDNQMDGMIRTFIGSLDEVAKTLDNFLCL